jgi:hypothetical protein
MFQLAPLLAVLAAADASGQWSANGTRFEVKDEMGALVGRVAVSGGSCPLPVGAEVLRGTLIDDSFSGEVRVCLLSPSCGKSTETGRAALLLAGTLSGAVHAEVSCAREVHTLILRRPDQPAETAPPIRPEIQSLLDSGASLLQKGQVEEARKQFASAAEKDPKSAAAFNGVGVTYYTRGELEDAIVWYKRAITADPAFGDALYNLACAYARRGQTVLAFRYLQLAALNGYADRKLLQTDPDLEGLRGDPNWTALLGQIR